MHMANEQYQQNSHKDKRKTWQLGLQTLERYWASFQVTTLFHNATNFFNQAITRMKSFSFFGWVGGVVGGDGGGWGVGGVGGVGVGGWGGWGGGGGRVHSSNAFTIWCCIPISRPPRVIRRFKRRSCVYHIDGLVQERHNSSVLGMELYIFLALTHRYYDVLCFKQYYLAYGSACHCKWLKAVFDHSFCLEALTNDF